MTARYAVFGHPVAHSLSPRIHAAFGKQAGIALEYAAIDTPPDFLPSPQNAAKAAPAGTDGPAASWCAISPTATAWTCARGAR